MRRRAGRSASIEICVRDFESMPLITKNSAPMKRRHLQLQLKVGRSDDEANQISNATCGNADSGVCSTNTAKVDNANLAMPRLPTKSCKKGDSTDAGSSFATACRIL